MYTAYDGGGPCGIGLRGGGLVCARDGAVEDEEGLDVPPTAYRIIPPTTSAVFAVAARACPLNAWAFARVELVADGEVCTAGEFAPDPDAGVPGVECVM